MSFYLQSLSIFLRKRVLSFNFLPVIAYRLQKMITKQKYKLVIIIIKDQAIEQLINQYDLTS